MEITSRSHLLFATQKPAANDPVGNTDKQFKELLAGADEDPAAMLKEMTSGGIESLWKWQIKKLKEKLAAQVMQEMNLTPEQIAAMPAVQRMSVEEKIMKEVERRVQELVRNGMEKKNANPLGFNALSFDSSTLQGLIETAQKI